MGFNFNNRKNLLLDNTTMFLTQDNKTFRLYSVSTADAEGNCQVYSVTEHISLGNYSKNLNINDLLLGWGGDEIVIAINHEISIDISF